MPGKKLKSKLLLFIYLQYIRQIFQTDYTISTLFKKLLIGNQIFYSSITTILYLFFNSCNCAINSYFQ